MLVGQLGLEHTLEVLRSRQPMVTARQWVGSGSSDMGGSMVTARIGSSSSRFVVASSTGEWEARAVARSREFASVYACCVSALVAVVRGATLVAADTVDAATGVGWGDRRTPWFWFGWNPEEGELTRPTFGDMESWTPILASGGSMVHGSRTSTIPRDTVADPWSVWSVSAEDPHVVVRAEPGTPADKVVVARFTRVEDAAFMPVAREAIAQFGPVLEAVRRFAYQSVRGELDSGELMELMESTPPWPLRREPRTV